jgi:hypothetical protein
MWATCPRSASSGYHAQFHEGCYQKHTNPLNFTTSSSDISAYLAGARHGMCELMRHGMAGELHGHGMACVN